MRPETEATFLAPSPLSPLTSVLTEPFQRLLAYLHSASSTTKIRPHRNESKRLSKTKMDPNDPTYNDLQTTDKNSFEYMLMQSMFFYFFYKSQLFFFWRIFCGCNKSDGLLWFETWLGWVGDSACDRYAMEITGLYCTYIVYGIMISM